MRLMDVNDPKALLAQYGNPTNLSARQRLHERYSTNPTPWLAWVFDQLLAALPPAASILELGAGNGILWATNRARVPPAWSLILTDLSEGMLRASEASLRADFPTIRYAQVDAHALPFPDASIDAVVANHMLYHVKDRSCALREMRRVLKPTGKAFIATNGMRHLEELRDAELLALLYCNGAAPASEADPNRFTLEAGRAEIAAVFGRVDLAVYENAPDALRVTDVVSGNRVFGLTVDALGEIVSEFPVMASEFPSARR